MTRRELEVLEALGERLSNAEIAAQLYVSVRTVESHVSSLMRKLGATRRRELTQIWAASRPQVEPFAMRLPPVLELLADPATFVGRPSERARLGDLWRRANEGQRLVAIVVGEAGIGKSRLAAELALQVQHDGGEVQLGSCFEDLGIPYEPFVQIIEADAARLSDSELGTRSGVRVLARVAPELASRLGVAEPSYAEPSSWADRPSERAALLSALDAYLCAIARRVAQLVVIEDLHWSTATTCDALRHVCRVGAAVPMLVLVTCRDAPPDLDDELAAFLSELGRMPVVQVIALSGLSVNELGGLLAGTTSVRPAAEVHAATDGNPLLALEVARTTGGTGVMASLLAARYDRLARTELDVLDVAVVVGAEFDATLVAAVADRSVEDTVKALEAAERAGLVTALPGRPGRFTFVHALFRSARYTAMPTGRRLQFHQRVTSELAPRAGDDRVIIELAHHACAAAPLGDPRAAIDYARRAGELAADSLAFAEAAAQYRRALQVADLHDSADLPLRCELMIRLGEALTWAGDPEARTLLTAAAPVARRLGRPELLAAIAWTLSPASFGSPFFDDPFVLEIAAEALASLGSEPTATRARLLAVLGPEASGHDDADDRPGVEAEAIDVARHLDDPITLGQVLATYQWSHRTPENLDERIATADELDRLGERLGQLNLRQRAHAAQFWNLLELGHVAAAWHAAALNEALIRDHERSAFTVSQANRRATRLYLAGDLTAAERATETLLTVAKTLAVAAGLDPMHYYVPHLAMIRFNQGRIGEAVPLIEDVVTAHPNIVTYEAILALALARTGDRDAARTTLRRLTDNGVAAIPRNWLWYTGLVALSDVADLTGDLDAAAILEEQLTPYSGRLATHVTGVSNPIDIALAQLALTRGDNQRAATLAAKAVQASRRVNTPVFLARGLLQQAAAVERLRGHQADTRAFVDEALAIGQTTQAGLILQEATRYRLT